MNRPPIVDRRALLSSMTREPRRWVQARWAPGPISKCRAVFIPMQISTWGLGGALISFWVHLTLASI
jgi:hypothetical protein